MGKDRYRRERQLIGIATMVAALAALGILGLWTAPTLSGSQLGLHLALGGALAAATIVAYRFPIYIRHSTKLYVYSITLYMMAALVSPLIAGVAALLAVGIGEKSVQGQRGTIAGDIMTHAGRWAVLVTGASLLAHLPGPEPVHYGALVAAAAFMLCGDFLTVLLSLVPASGERPERLIPSLIKEAGIIEASQYVIGITGVLVATQQVWAVALLILPAVLVYMTFRKEMSKDTLWLLESFADTIDARDPYLGEHSRRVARLTRGMLDLLEMHGDEGKLIELAARLHDLGKLELPDTLLNKHGELTPEEEVVLQSYPLRGASFLQAYPEFSRGIEMVRHHHERWDGHGYPGRLAGTDIPFGARMIAVADSYDALIHERPHRPALSSQQAVQILLDGRGRQWDPSMVDLLLKSINAHLPQPAGSAIAVGRRTGESLAQPAEVIA